MKVAYSVLKTFVTTRGLSVQYLEFDDRYELVALDSTFTVETTLIKGQSEEIADFEATLKPGGNKPITVRSALGNVIYESAPLVTGAVGTRAISMVTHDLTDRTSWYQKSVQVVTETLANPSTDLLTYTSANPWWVNVTGASSKLTYTYNQIPKRDGSYALHTAWDTLVYVDGVLQATAAYVINYVTGVITFGAALTEGAVVTATYWHNNNVAQPSEWLLVPPAGKKYLIQHVELQFTKPCVINDTIRFEIWAGLVLAGPPKAVNTAGYGTFSQGYYAAGYGQGRYDYRNMRDIINAANQGQGFIEPIGEITQPVIIFPFNYVQAIGVDSAVGALFRMVLLNDIAITGGNLATATFYLQVSPS